MTQQIFSTFDQKQAHLIQDFLKDNHIESEIKRSSQTEHVYLSQARLEEYQVWIEKQDYLKAVSLLEKNGFKVILD
ncbi:MAG: hypothetical protein ACPGJV_05415 [Bacteriovoracaceae bacterium]